MVMLIKMLQGLPRQQAADGPACFPGWGTASGIWHPCSNVWWGFLLDLAPGRARAEGGVEGRGFHPAAAALQAESLLALPITFHPIPFVPSQPQWCSGMRGAAWRHAQVAPWGCVR